MSSTLLTRKGEPVTNQAGPTAIDDAALIIEDEAVAWTGPAPTAPPACLPGWLRPSSPELADLRFPPATIPLQKRAKYSAI